MSVVVVVACVFGAVASFGVDVSDNGAAPARFDDVLAGRDAPALSGDDVLALDRYVGGDALGLVRAVGAAVDGARDGCALNDADVAAQARVGRHLLAIALLEAAKERGGAAMALSTTADLAVTLNRCLPFGSGTSVATELAQKTAALATYLRTHGALDDADAKALSTSLSSLAPAQAKALARPTVVTGALVLAPAGVKCRVKDGRSVLSAAEAREIGRRYQARPPQLTPVFGPRGIEGLRVVVDAFLASCGLMEGDVVQSVNGVRAEQPDRLLTVGDRIAADRKAVVVVVRGGAAVTVVVEEDKT